MKTIRTFLAIPLPPLLAQSASQWISEMKGASAEPNRPIQQRGVVSPESPSAAMGIKWVPEDNLHLTLKFLGEVENIEVPKICDVVEEVCRGFDPFDLNFVGSGFLPDKARARVLTVAIDDPAQSLTAMVKQLEEQFADLGFKREPRDYVPHLTLGRVRGGSRRIAEHVVQRWSQYEHEPMGEMVVECVQVIGSFLEKRGPTYNVMNTVEL